MNPREGLRTSSKRNISIHFFLKSRPLRYLFVGGLSTAIHILIASLFLRFVNQSIFSSNICGFLTAYVFSYIMQSKLVFQTNLSSNKAIKYFIVQFFGLMLTILASNLIHLSNAYVQTVIVAFSLAILSFSAHTFWTFKKKASTP
jgi:putative flippase GtrA